MTKPTIRFSALDRIAACPASYLESQGKPSSGSDDSALGSARHEAMSEVARIQDPSLVNYAALAAKWQVDADKIREPVVGCGYVPPQSALTEHPVKMEYETFDVVGTADLIVQDTNLVVDYKFTESRTDAATITERLQVPGYAAAAWGMALVVPPVKAAIFNPLMGGEDGWSWAEIDPVAVRNTIREVGEAALAQEALPVERRQYRFGDWCRYCPGATTCPILLERMKQVPAILGQQGSMTRESLPAYVQLAKAMEKKLESFIDSVKLEVRTNGEIKSDAGRLYVTTSSRPTTPSAKKVLDFLREKYPEAAADVERWMSSLAPVEIETMRFTANKEALL